MGRVMDETDRSQAVDGMTAALNAIRSIRIPTDDELESEALFALCKIVGAPSFPHDITPERREAYLFVAIRKHLTRWIAIRAKRFNRVRSVADLDQQPFNDDDGRQRINQDCPNDKIYARDMADYRDEKQLAPDDVMIREDEIKAAEVELEEYRQAYGSTTGVSRKEHNIMRARRDRLFGKNRDIKPTKYLNTKSSRRPDGSGKGDMGDSATDAGG